MRRVTLRLSEEQHTALTREAAENARSLHGEAVHRLFREPIQLLSVRAQTSDGIRVGPDDDAADSAPANHA